jgi:hypothetical protein
MSPEQVAKEFVANLENDPIAKYKFLTANYQNSIWLQCPPYQGEAVDFWQYGPPIPNASGYIYLLAEIWYHGGWGGWIIRFPPQSTKNGTYEFEEAKKVIEMKVAEKWGPANDGNLPAPWRRCAGENETYVYFTGEIIRAYVYSYEGKWHYFVDANKSGVAMNRADAMACADTILWPDIYPVQESNANAP